MITKMDCQELEIIERKGRILILTSMDDAFRELVSMLDARLPGCEFYHAKAVESYGRILTNEEIDVAILDFNLSGAETLELIQSSKVKDCAPTVILMNGASNASVMAHVYEAGCHKYFASSDQCRSEIADTVQHALRLRKLQEENMRLVARLTEANILLEEKNRRLDEFSATVAHDIRGPLGGVVMKLDFLLDRYKDEINDQFASILHGALASSQRLTDIVQAMYEFAKLGSKAAKMGPVDLNSLVEEVINDMSFDESRDISFCIGNLPMVWGNRQLLSRVFINLISNAVKYSDKQETIINIQLNNYVERSISRFAEIYVQDNGPGIEEVELKDIFRFFSRGSAGKKDNDGLGVGLSVVQRIVELHFGAVRVESKVNEGTVFFLSLPTEKIDFIK